MKFKNNLINKIFSDSRFRLLLTSSFSSGWNFIYAIFNICMAVIYKSFWFLTLGVYYFALACMRGAILVHGKSEKDKRPADRVVRHVGIGFFMLSIIFCGTVVLSIYENHSTGYGTIVMITMAAYTFYLFTLAIINTIKAGKRRDMKLMTLRNISLGAVVVSMFSLEKSMLATFTEDAAEFIFRMEIFTGAGIFLIIIALGINTIIISRSPSFRS